jgi:hypothetical protein
MTPRLLALPLFLALAACVQDSGPSEPYAFVGTWDCGVATYAFTNSTYNDGTNTYPIQTVAKNDRNYTLRFANGYTIALVAVTSTGLTWVSGTTGTQLNCRRVN